MNHQMSTSVDRMENGFAMLSPVVTSHMLKIVGRGYLVHFRKG